MKTALANNLTIARHTRGWSQERVAIFVRIKRARYGCYERNTQPSLKVLQRLAKLYDITPNQFYDFCYNPEFFKNSCQ